MLAWHVAADADFQAHVEIIDVGLACCSRC
uniref:Uncharacterized protein n=1 Tax=Arundo donax TaxID=35708 RepID=A0A0A8ZJU2_ARUDO